MYYCTHNSPQLFSIHSQTMNGIHVIVSLSVRIYPSQLYHCCYIQSGQQQMICGGGGSCLAILLYHRTLDGNIIYATIRFGGQQHSFKHSFSHSNVRSFIHIVSTTSFICLLIMRIIPARPCTRSLCSTAVERVVSRNFQTIICRIMVTSEFCYSFQLFVEICGI